MPNISCEYRNLQGGLTSANSASSLAYRTDLPPRLDRLQTILRKIVGAGATHGESVACRYGVTHVGSMRFQGVLVEY